MSLIGTKQDKIVAFFQGPPSFKTIIKPVPCSPIEAASTGKCHDAPGMYEKLTRLVESVDLW